FQMGKADDPLQLLVGGYTGRQIGLYTAGFALLFVVGIAAWSLAFGRLRATQIMAIALVGLFALAGSLFLLNHSHPSELLRIRGLIGLVSVSLLVASGFTPAALVYLAGLAEEFPRSRGGMMGLYSVFLGVGQFIGSGLGGFFADWRGVDGMVVLTVLLGILSAGCVAALARQDSRLGPTARDAGAVRMPHGLH
ncbi:MAG: MFS transporter, partial [Longimicrobiales bacterium]|nr:MFS transporter [Longimicrobiales bacterium]